MRSKKYVINVFNREIENILKSRVDIKQAAALDGYEMFLADKCTQNKCDCNTLLALMNKYTVKQPRKRKAKLL